MEQEKQAEKTRIFQREDGVTITVHYAGDKPSLQEKMEEIIKELYQTKSAKI